MPRNSSGSYSLPAANPVVTGTNISSTWANNTLADVASEVTNSLDRQGRGQMQAPLPLADGSSSLPGLTFNSETNSGLYRAGSNDIRLQIAAVLIQKWLSTGSLMPLGLTITQSQSNTPALVATGNGTAAGATFTGGSSDGAGATFAGGGTSGVGGQFTGTVGRGAVGLTVASADPSSPTNGDVWVSGSGSSFAAKVRLNGATYTLAKTLDQQALTLSASWSGTVNVWSDGWRVWLEGTATNGTGAPALAITGASALPVAFRPSGNILLPCIKEATGPLWSAHPVSVRSDGQLTLTTTVQNGESILLDGVSWRLGR